MTTPDVREEPDFHAWLQEMKESGHQPHRFWRASKAVQQERYEKILIAAIETAREEGYEAVQMRSIAKRSGASLATVYTYFTSRDYLVFRAVIAWASLIRWRSHHEVRHDEDPPAERLVKAWTREMQAWREEPRLLETWVRSTMTRDERVVEGMRTVDWAHWAAEAERLSPDRRLRDHLLLANEVFFAGAVHWAFGQEDLDRVIERTLAFTRHPLEELLSRS